MSRAPISLFAGALAVVLIAAGCGSSSSDSAGDASASGGSAVSTKAELIKQGDEICTQGIEQIKTESAAYLKQVGVKKGGLVNPSQYEHFQTEIFLPGLNQQTEEIRALGAPGGEEDEVNEILDAFEAGIKKAEKDPSKLPTPQSPLLEPNKMFAKYGFKSCGLN